MLDIPESTTEAQTAVPPRESQRLHHMDDSYAAILLLTGPLVLSSTGLMFMHLFDAIMLSWYSRQAIAVVGAASMSAFLVICFFIGIASYTTTFVAQYMGAGRQDRVGAAVWQGIYVGLAAGALVAALGTVIAKPLFHWVGHAPALEVLEARYFLIMCYGSTFSLVGSAVSGFFSGRGDNRTLMLVQLGGFICNSFLSYAAIFGHWGLPEFGAVGAAYATAVAQAAVALILFILFLRRTHRERFQTWSSRGLNIKLTRRMMYFGSFSGLRAVTELLGWTLFLFFIGRLGEDPLAITSIVWRLNGIAFFPLIGLSTAIATLVGYMQGSQRSDRAEVVTWRGVLMAEAWMLFAASLFVLIPRQLLSLFTSGEMAVEFAPLIETGVVLLRFVALYCLLDGLNIVFLGALQGAGDTRWTMYASAVLHLAFLTALFVLDSHYRNLYAFWTAATAFVMLQAGVWLSRFQTKKWKSMRVIEVDTPEAIDA
jgi:MATE family multidrug resistance protein